MRIDGRAADCLATLIDEKMLQLSQVFERQRSVSER